VPVEEILIIKFWAIDGFATISVVGDDVSPHSSNVGLDPMELGTLVRQLIPRDLADAILAGA
jgi:hypothetical protein